MGRQKKKKRGKFQTLGVITAVCQPTGGNSCCSHHTARFAARAIVDLLRGDDCVRVHVQGLFEKNIITIMIIRLLL